MCCISIWHNKRCHYRRISFLDAEPVDDTFRRPELCKRVQESSRVLCQFISDVNDGWLLLHAILPVESRIFELRSLIIKARVSIPIPLPVGSFQSSSRQSLWG